ncbi:uncharacterized protein DNG_00412 [Cephalotrichum gorgonifer]|uniref:DNA replication regulator Sld3 C-terminal domain-containing protein n=1 Tax=Cephalotrichum gorgonifer TaxID=2041049 RepID=A0AAE8MQL4_9PEZI|nr:uncharacterized protein DNG_00412 [Cephalotrichum gorgonifer]
MEDLLKPTITVKAHPPKLLSKPAVLQPLMILPRHHIPLSHLDLASPSGDLPPSRFYESHVRILDLENRRGGGPYLLIARSEKPRHLYAIEAFEHGLYTVCKLGSWVELSRLRSKATLSCEQLLEPVRVDRPDEGAAAAQPLTTPGMHKANKEKRIAIEALQSVVRKKRTQSISSLPPLSQGGLSPPTTFADSCPPSTNTEDPVPTQESQHSIPLPVEPAQPCAPPPPPCGEELLERIRTQYFDALYRSKGSLAYFPKGPLSRARATFNLESDINLSMADLVSFLKGLLIPLRQMNKKYQETIPNIIKEMKTHVDSSGDDKRKKRKARKMKFGRNGLYPREDDDLKTWWVANKPELKDGEASIPESQIKSYIALLRSRETQLQIILLLEILALEPLAASVSAADSQLPGVQQSVEVDFSEKKTKGQNLHDLVDLHADLLCIWQSTASDETRLLEDSQVTDHAREGQTAQRTSSEPLKDFCVDIVIPFFSSRLPEVCDSLSRKLGGPSILISPKTKQHRPKAPAKQPRPGAVTKRAAPLQRAKSLQRAFSSDQADRDRRSMSKGPSKAVAALLSATEMAIPGLKREGSESQSLMSIPRMKSDCGLLKSARPASLSRSSSFAADEMRKKKQAILDAELHDAIATIRKPNRQLVGAATVEAAERRTSGSLSQTRKTKKPVRLSPSEHVQVKATPMHNRYRDLGTAGQPRPSAIAWPLARASPGELPPSSNPSVIPSTAPRRSFRDALQDTTTSPEFSAIGSTPARPAAADRIEGTPVQPGVISATPVRRSTMPASASVDAIPGSSPLMMKRAVPVAVHTGGMRSLTEAFKAPVKPRPAAHAEESESEMAPAAAPAAPRKMSVYEKLGWDDEYDDL